MPPKFRTRKSDRRLFSKMYFTEASHVRGSSFPVHGSQRCQTDVGMCRVCTMSPAGACGPWPVINGTKATHNPTQTWASFKHFLIVKLPLADFLAHSTKYHTIKQRQKSRRKTRKCENEKKPQAMPKERCRRARAMLINLPGHPWRRRVGGADSVCLFYAVALKW